MLGFIDFIVAPTMEVCGDLLDRVHLHLALLASSPTNMASQQQQADGDSTRSNNNNNTVTIRSKSDNGDNIGTNTGEQHSQQTSHTLTVDCDKSGGASPQTRTKSLQTLRAQTSQDAARSGDKGATDTSPTSTGDNELGPPSDKQSIPR